MGDNVNGPVAKLIEWARDEQAFPVGNPGGEGRGHIDENHRFKLRDMVQAIDASTRPGLQPMAVADRATIKSSGNPIIDRLNTVIFHCNGDVTIDDAARLATDIGNAILDDDDGEVWGLSLTLASAPAGDGAWQTVPIEATEGMCEAGWQYADSRDAVLCLGEIRDLYAAMLSAAPAALARPRAAVGIMPDMAQALLVFAACARDLIGEPDAEWAKFRLMVSDYRRAYVAYVALTGQEPPHPDEAHAALTGDPLALAGKSIMPAPRLIERKADAECGCPEELWDAHGAHLHMHLNAGKPSNGHADFGDDGEAEVSVTASTIDLARAAIMGWAQGFSQSIDATPEPYLVWSNEHRAWWKPNSQGYTRDVSKAGRYPRSEALVISSTRGGGWPGDGNPYEIMVLESDALAMVERGRR